MVFYIIKWKEWLSIFDNLIFVKDENGVIIGITEFGTRLLVFVGIGMSKAIFMSVLRLLKLNVDN